MRLRYIGDYELLEEIGRGGMGVVFRARQVSLNRIVAVKMIISGHLAGPAAVGRFWREAESAAQLDHPGIVAIHEIGEHEGCPYYSMDFVRGGPLFLSETNGPLDVRRAATYVKGAAEAMHYAHLRGVVHRDLKPANILIDEHDQPRITDFGLARGLLDTTSFTLSGQLLGSPSFMPPEQASGRFGIVGPSSDVYALGAVLYYLLAARPPFLGASPEQTIQLVSIAEAVSPRILNPSVPRDLETICLKCLEKEPSRRYASAQALAEDLGRFLVGEPIDARPISRAERLWRWARRNPGIALPSALAAALLIAIAVIATASAVRIRKARDQAEAEKTKAQTQQRLAEMSEAERRYRLARLKVSQGWQLAESGDLLGALVPFAEALILETNEPARLEMHRFRIATVLQQSPRIERMWFPGGPIKYFEMSPDGRWLLTATSSFNDTTNAAAQVWEVESGQAVSAPMIHSGPINHAAFSADGRLVVTASADRTARVWDAATGRPVSPPVSHIDRVVHATFSPDNERVVSGTSSWPETNGSFLVWHARTGRIVCSQEIRGMDVQRVMFDAEGSRVIIGSRTYLCNFFDALSGKKVAHLPIWNVYELRYSPDRRLIAVAGAFGEKSQPGARIFDAVRLESVAPLLRYENGPALSVAFSPDGRRLATGGTDQHVGVWDVITGESLTDNLRHQGPVVSTEFSLDGRFVVTASSDRTARIWDWVCNDLAAPPLRHGGAVCRAVFTADGQRVVTGSQDGAMRVWQLWPEPPHCSLIRTESDLLLARYSRNGHQIATGERDGAVRFWDSENAARASPLLQHPDPIQQVLWFKDGTRVLTRAGQYDMGWIRVWPLAMPDSIPLPFFEATSASISPGEQEIVIANQWAPSSLLNADTGRPVPGALSAWLRTTRKDAVNESRYSPDGRRLVTAQSSGVATVWDLSTQQRLSNSLPHDDVLHDACFSPDCQWIATACHDGFAYLCRFTGGPPVRLRLQHIAPVRRVLFSPDGQTLLSWGDDPTARVWEVPSGKLVCPPLTHQASLTEAGFSPDGRLIATASLDGTARLWDPTTGEPLTPPLRHGDAVRTVEFHPFGLRLLTAAADQTLRQWNLPSNEEPIAHLLDLVALLSAGAPQNTADNSLPEVWQRLRPPLPSGPSAATNDGNELSRCLLAAATAEAREEWSRAVAILRRILELKPTDSDIHFRRACAQLRLRKWEEAAADFTAAFCQNTNAAACVLGRSLARSQTGNGPGTSADFRLALGLAKGFRDGPWQPASSARPDPSSPAHWRRLHEQASIAMLVNSNDASALAVRAVVEGVQSDWASASTTFARAISIRTNDPLPRLGRALALRNRKLSNLAIPAGSATIRLAPNDPLPWALRGEAHFHMSQMTNAVADLERAVALGLETPDLRLLLADAETALEHWSQAVTQALRAVDSEELPAIHKAVWLLANGPSQVRDADRALALARLGVQKSPDAAVPLLDLGLALYRRDEWPAAVERLEAAERLPGGKSSPCSFLLALSHHRMGQQDNAVSCFRRAVRQEPADTPKYLRLVDLAREARQTLGLPADP